MEEQSLKKIQWRGRPAIADFCPKHVLRKSERSEKDLSRFTGPPVLAWDCTPRAGRHKAISLRIDFIGVDGMREKRFSCDRAPNYWNFSLNSGTELRRNCGHKALGGRLVVRA